MCRRRHVSVASPWNSKVEARGTNHLGPQPGGEMGGTRAPPEAAFWHGKWFFIVWWVLSIMFLVKRSWRVVDWWKWWWWEAIYSWANLLNERPLFAQFEFSYHKKNHRDQATNLIPSSWSCTVEETPCNFGQNSPQIWLVSTRNTAKFGYDHQIFILYRYILKFRKPQIAQL